MAAFAISLVAGLFVGIACIVILIINLQKIFMSLADESSHIGDYVKSIELESKLPEALDVRAPGDEDEDEGPEEDNPMAKIE